MSRNQTPLERFNQKIKIDQSTRCWNWIGCFDGEPRGGTNPRGRYGRFALDGYKMIGAHRASYLLFVGQVPAEMMVCHRCDNPSYVNPDHLFIGTGSDNQQDSIKKKRHWMQKAGYVHPMLGTGQTQKIGRYYYDKELVQCFACGKEKFQRRSDRRAGKHPACSKSCASRVRWIKSKGRVECRP